MKEYKPLCPFQPLREAQPLHATIKDSACVVWSIGMGDTRFSRRFHVSKMSQRVREAARSQPISIVYKAWSTEGGPLRYIGRSDLSLSRAQDYVFNASSMEHRLGIRIVWLSIQSFRGPDRKREAFERACVVYHTDEGGCLVNTYHPARPAGSWFTCPICEG